MAYSAIVRAKNRTIGFALSALMLNYLETELGTRAYLNRGSLLMR